MNVVLDTTILTLFLKPNVIPPNDPKTGKPVDRAAERIEYLLEELQKAGARVLVPTPVLAEFLVIADESGPDYLNLITDQAFFEIAVFDALSAVEAGAAQRKALLTGNQKLDLTGSRQCVKADRQIVAVAKTRNVDTVYTADTDIQKIGKHAGVQVVMLWEIALPPSNTPLLDNPVNDEAKASDETSSTGPEQPSGQSESADEGKAQPSAPDPLSGPPAGPEPQQPGSSPTVPPPPRSEQ